MTKSKVIRGRDCDHPCCLYGSRPRVSRRTPTSPEGAAADQYAAPARGHGARICRTDPEIHAELSVQPEGICWKSAPERRQPTTSSSGVRARAWGGQVQFADWTPVFEKHAQCHSERRSLLRAGTGAAQLCWGHCGPDAGQQQDLDFTSAIGHFFALVVYGQLILEQAAITGLDRGSARPDLRLPVRDFNANATTLYGRPSATPAQQGWAAFDTAPSDRGSPAVLGPRSGRMSRRTTAPMRCARNTGPSDNEPTGFGELVRGRSPCVYCSTRIVSGSGTGGRPGARFGVAPDSGLARKGGPSAGWCPGWIAKQARRTAHCGECVDTDSSDRRGLAASTTDRHATRYRFRR